MGLLPIEEEASTIHGSVTHGEGQYDTWVCYS